MQKPPLAAYIIEFDGKMRTLTPILKATVPRRVDFCIEGTCQLLVRFYLSKMGLKCQIIKKIIMFSYATMWNDGIKCWERKETK